MSCLSEIIFFNDNLLRKIANNVSEKCIVEISDYQGKKNNQ